MSVELSAGTFAGLHDPQEAELCLYISGTRVKYQSIGQYEDYCPIHRGLHTFEQQQVRSQSLWGCQESLSPTRSPTLDTNERSSRRSP